VAFLERLQSYPQLPLEHITLLGTLYNFSTTSNAEIRFRFYQIAILDPTSASGKAFAAGAAKWIIGDDGTGIIKGRMKFCRPVFKAVAKVDIQVARSAFQEKEDEFHPIARKLIAKVC
jgi:leukotriene-A4 hydrolase